MKRGILYALLACALCLHGSSAAQTMFTASLDTSLEVLAQSSHATGTAWAVLEADGTTLTYGVTYVGLSANRTGSHFHVGAPGVNGSVVQPITFTGNTANGTWTSVPDSVVRALYRGDVYVNIHSSVNPGGEIRGQLLPVQGVGFTMHLNGAQESNSTSNGTGTGWAVLDTTGVRLRYQITVASLDSGITGAHFHIGAPGVNGTIVHPITVIDSTAAGTWVPIPDSLVVPLLRGNLYANIHTAKYPGGEIRGQLLLSGPITFTASMDGNQETPSVATPAKGTLWLTLNKDLTSFVYDLTYAQLSGPPTGAHLHTAPIGVPGTILVPIPLQGNWSSQTGGAPPDSVLRLLVQHQVYANIHSSAHPGGEIRGQLMPVPGPTFTFTLDGAHENPPVETGAHATGWAMLDSTGKGLEYQITVAGLSDSLTGSHFHTLPGGNVVKPITFAPGDSTVRAFWTDIADTLMTNLFNGKIYANIHSKAHPGGEIRGTLNRNQEVVNGVEEISQQTPVSFTLRQNYPNPFNPSTLIEYSLPVSGRVTLKVFNVLGQEVATLFDGVQAAGTYRATFNGQGLSTGVYFYRLISGSGPSQVKKMLLVK